MKYDPEEILAKWATAYHNYEDHHNQICIINDGYAEDDDGNTDVSLICYAIFIHKDSGNPTFIFPEHEIHIDAVIHRPNEECCFFVWLREDSDGSVSVEFVSEGRSNLDIDFFYELIIEIQKNYDDGVL